MVRPAPARGVAIERVFADTNVSTVMGTAQVTGIVMIIAERLGLPVTLHTPTEVKAAVSGSGRADKAQVTTMVTRLLGLDHAPKPADAADALALAICHVWRGGTQSRLEQARVEMRRPHGHPAGRHTPTGAPRRPLSPTPPWSPATMIASLSGTVLKVGLDTVVVGVGGVGMLVHTTPATATSVRLGQPAELATSLVVREDSLTLYGFATDDEKLVFETVQTVSGVGPRLALAVLAVHSPDAVRVALGTGDLVALTKVPGIGKQGRRAARPRAQGQARRAARVERDRGAGAARHGRGRGASRCARPSSVSAGPCGRPTTRSTGWRPRPPRGPSVSALLRAALQELGR